MSGQHTPGPWSCEDVYAPRVTVHIPVYGKACVLSECFSMESAGEREANAKLIAAAPELLEALHELLTSQLTEIPPYECGKEAQDAWSDRRAAAINNARFVIDKATGARS